MNQAMGINIDKAVVQKLAMDAFDMVFEGNTDDARRVFSAINQIKPENRPSKLGLAMIDLVSESSSNSDGHSGHFECDDSMICCFQALAWLQHGRKAEAKTLLEPLKHSEDSSAAALARHIIHYEIEGK